MWRGDFQNARQLLQARQGAQRYRVDIRTENPATAEALTCIASPNRSPRTLGMLLIPFEATRRRAPDARAACLTMAPRRTLRHIAAPLQRIVAL
jgi:hypothetical protein